MRTPLSRLIIPTTFELWCVACCAAALLLAGNAKLLLEHYNLISSSTVVGQELSDRFTSGLGVLDSFSLTPGLVTFTVWGAIGLIVFSLAQAVLRASNALHYERDLGSNRYVHPESFSRERYWQRVAQDSLASFGLLCLLAVAGGFYLLCIVPVSFFYLQGFLLHLSLSRLMNALLGIFTAFAGTLGLYIILKLVLWHHRRSRQ